ncbi:MAG: acylphosphatase [Methanobacteriota archaeon]
MRLKRYSIVLKGRVQDVSFRSRIISTAKIYNLSGYPPINDLDGSVKMICEGPEELLQKFLKDIEIREELPSGIRVEEVEKKEIPIDFPLPSRFAAVEVEELSNISRKMDICNERLKGIESSLGEIKGDIGGIRGDIGEIKGDIGGIKVDIGGIKGDTGEIKGDIGEIKGTLRSMDAKLNNLDDIKQILTRIAEK